ncbi:MAG TPA: YbaY family lipoprotein [Opitutaceae bacterium]|nr:YbaY family lipoprotein [Opitutaceae bacterium]
MKTFLRFVLPLAALLLTAGCGHLDLQSEGDPDRVLTGTVNFHASEPLPPDAVVTVRLVDPTGSAGLPLVLGEQTIEHPGSPPIPFRIEYRADDDRLRRGLSLEARVSIGGKLRFYNVNGYGVTLAKAGDPHEIWVNPSGKE